MRSFRFAPLLVLLPALASAQEPGVAVNMGRGLDNGGSVNWTFKENWTLRPTIGAAYSQVTGFQASIGSTILRSFPIGDRFYAYLGAGIYYGSANTGTTTGFAGPQTVGGARSNQVVNSVYQTPANITYVTAPAGLRARVYGNFEAFLEGAYQRTLTGQFGLSQSGQFAGNGSERFGATLGISLRLR